MAAFQGNSTANSASQPFAATPNSNVQHSPLGNVRKAVGAGLVSPPQTPPNSEANGCLFTSCMAGPASVCREGNSGSVTADEVQNMINKMKMEVLGAMRADIKELTSVIQQSNAQIRAGFNDLAITVQHLQRDVDASRDRRDAGSSFRLATCVQRICSASGGDAIARRSRDPGRQRGSTADEPEPQLIPSTLAPGLVRGSLTNGQVVADGAKIKRSNSSSSSLLAPVLRSFTDASKHLEAEEVDRKQFIEGLEEYAKLLNLMGGNMGTYLDANIKKLRNSKAHEHKTGYREWLLSELPVHQATSYKEYVDDSGWMANLWIGRTLEFFVEMFSHLHQGKETRPAVEVAYKDSLYEHHNFFQRTAFTTAVRQLPPRDMIFKKLQGGGMTEDVIREIGKFVALARPLAAFCSTTNVQLDKRLQAERKSFLKK